MNPSENNIWHMVLGSGPVVMGVLLILVSLSVSTWAIAVAKYLQFKKVSKESSEFRELFWESRSISKVNDSARRLAASPLSAIFRAGYRELLRLSPSLGLAAEHTVEDLRGDLARGSEMTNAKADSIIEFVTRALKHAELEEGNRLEQGVPFLATVASAAPFIGLFGTVWGIMNAFIGLGAVQNSTLQAVAPGISEALVATAVGLAAAIPASWAYNFCSVNIRRYKAAMREFSDEFIVFAREMELAKMIQAEPRDQRVRGELGRVERAY